MDGRSSRRGGGASGTRPRCHAPGAGQRAQPLQRNEDQPQGAPAALHRGRRRHAAQHGARRRARRSSRRELRSRPSINDRRALARVDDGHRVPLIFADALEREAFADLVQEQCARSGRGGRRGVRRGSSARACARGSAGFDARRRRRRARGRRREAAPPAKKATRRSTALLQGSSARRSTRRRSRSSSRRSTLATRCRRRTSPAAAAAGQVSPPDLYVVAARVLVLGQDGEAGSADEKPPRPAARARRRLPTRRTRRARARATTSRSTRHARERARRGRGRAAGGLTGGHVSDRTLGGRAPPLLRRGARGRGRARRRRRVHARRGGALLGDAAARVRAAARRVARDERRVRPARHGRRRPARQQGRRRRDAAAARHVLAFVASPSRRSSTRSWPQRRLRGHAAACPRQEGRRPASQFDHVFWCGDLNSHRLAAARCPRSRRRTTGRPARLRPAHGRAARAPRARRFRRGADWLLPDVPLPKGGRRRAHRPAPYDGEGRIPVVRPRALALGAELEAT